MNPTHTRADARRRRLCAALLSIVAVPHAACAQTGARPSATGTPGTTGKPTRIGVIGSGRIGGTVGGLWVKAGHEVMFSSRHPEELKTMTTELGPRARAGTVADAIGFSDVLFLAVPYRALPELSEQNRGKFAGKVVLDATNAFAERDGAVGEEAIRNGIGLTTAKYLQGASVVRGFNSMGAIVLAKENHREGSRIAIPLAGDDQAALAIASRLVNDAGFEPVVVGALSTAPRFAPGGSLFRQIGSADEFRRAMSRQEPR